MAIGREVQAGSEVARCGPAFKPAVSIYEIGHVSGNKPYTDLCPEPRPPSSPALSPQRRRPWEFPTGSGVKGRKYTFRHTGVRQPGASTEHWWHGVRAAPRRLSNSSCPGQVPGEAAPGPSRVRF